MAYVNYRFRRKTASGGYDTYHLESRSNLILRFNADGTQLTGNKANVELALSALESTVAGLVAGGGEPNKIDSISIAGTTTTPDSNKNVAIPAASSSAYGVVKVDGSVAAAGANPVTGKAVYDYASGAISKASANETAIATLNGSGAGSVSKAVSDAIGALDVSDSAQTAKVVSAVSQTDGKISVSHRALVAADIPTLAQSKITNLTTDLGNKLDASKVGAAGGAASLGSDGKVPASQLPSYVDDVIEGYLSDGKFYEEAAHTTEITGESGKIYVNLTDNKTYRYSGSAFIEISASLVLGTGANNAFYGDKGQIAYEHSQATHARTDATATAKSNTNGNIKINGTETVVYTHPSYTAKSSGLYKITVNASGHVSATAAVAKSDITGLGIVDIQFGSTQPTDQPTGGLWFESL